MISIFPTNQKFQDAPVRSAFIISWLFLLAPFGVSSALAQDVAAGEKVFKRCAACHSLEAGTNKIGPSLAGLLGRGVGSVVGFKYSKAMAGAGFVWTPEALDAFVTAPKKFVPGTRMPFAGLKDASQREALIAYLLTTTAKP